MKIFLALTLAGGLATCGLHAQGTISATATIIQTGMSGGNFKYSLTLSNTGSVAINAFWYGWTQGHFSLPGNPTSLTAPTGWTSTVDMNSVQYGNSGSSAHAIPAGGVGTFTFQSTFGPSAMASGMHDGDATGDSVVYANVDAMQGFDQSDPGIASNPFVPTLQTIPAPNFQAPAVIGGSIQLAWASLPGVAYQVQYSTNLAQTNWSNLGSVINATNNPTMTNDLIASSVSRFYRVVVSQ